MRCAHLDDALLEHVWVGRARPVTHPAPAGALCDLHYVTAPLSGAVIAPHGQSICAKALKLNRLNF